MAPAFQVVSYNKPSFDCAPWYSSNTSVYITFVQVQPILKHRPKFYSFIKLHHNGTRLYNLKLPGEKPILVHIDKSRFSKSILKLQKHNCFCCKKLAFFWQLFRCSKLYNITSFNDFKMNFVLKSTVKWSSTALYFPFTLIDININLVIICICHLQHKMPSHKHQCYITNL